MTTSTISLAQQLLLGATLSVFVGAVLAATPKEQKAMVQNGTGGPEVMKLQTIPVLDPPDGQVLIRVYAAAVNPTDWKSRAGAAGYSNPGPVSIPGGDVAGVIEKIGKGVSEFKVGDPVYAVVVRTATPLNGAYAQFAIAPVNTVVHKPSRVTYAQAAGLGVATITGVRAVEETKVAKGQRVLITGVAGGVGSAAAQAAKARGAYVIGTATERHNAYLKSLGVDEVIDYSKVKFEEKIKDMDAVIDTVGDDTAERALLSARKGGNYISVASRDIGPKCTAAGLNCGTRNSAGNLPRSLYDEVSSLANSGKLNVKVEKTFPLEQAGAAHELGALEHTEGKIVLIVDAAKGNRK